MQSNAIQCNAKNNNEWYWPADLSVEMMMLKGEPPLNYSFFAHSQGILISRMRRWMRWWLRWGGSGEALRPWLFVAFIDWLFVALIDWLLHWLIDCCIDWLFVALVGWLVDGLVVLACLFLFVLGLAACLPACLCVCLSLFCLLLAPPKQCPVARLDWEESRNRQPRRPGEDFHCGWGCVCVIDGWMDRLIEWWWLSHWLPNGLVDWLIAELVGGLVGKLIGWPIGLLWLRMMTCAWPIDWLIVMDDVWMTDWLLDWLIVIEWLWLSDWL